MAYPLAGLIVYVCEPFLNIIWIIGKDVVMVLAGDVAYPGLRILYRMISAVMTELELCCFAAEGKTDDLVPHTDAADREFAYERLYGIYSSGSIERISGPV